MGEYPRVVVDGTTTVSVTGTVAVTDNSESLTVDGTVAVSAVAGEVEIIEHSHEKIHESESWRSIAFDATLASAETLSLLMFVPFGVEPHMIFESSAPLAYNVAFYENPTLTAIGTAVSCINRHRGIPTATTVTCYSNPSTSALGTLLSGPWYYGGSATKASSSDRAVAEFIGDGVTPTGVCTDLLVNNVAGEATGQTTITVDSVAGGKVKMGMKVVFQGHGTIYTVTSPDATYAPGAGGDIVITPALTADVADDATVTISYAPSSCYLVHLTSNANSNSGTVSLSWYEE
jgi:hypothetical protein